MPTIPESSAVSAIGLKPQDAIKFFEKKGFAITWSWRDQLKLNNAQAFTVAKAMKMDVLTDIRLMIEQSLDKGLPFADFKKELKPMLQARGWWGKKEVIRPDGKKVVQLGSPHRLKTIYETNTQSSYNAGRWRAQEANKEARPFLKYLTVGDNAVRPEHEAMNGTVKPVNSPFWNSYYPPNGYNCRCRVRALTPEQLKKEGGVSRGLPRVTEGKDAGKIAKPDKGFKHNAGKQTLAFRPERKDYDSDIWSIAQPIVPPLALTPLLNKTKKQLPEEDNNE